MTLGRVPGRIPGVLGGHVWAPPSLLSRLARPQHCLSDRPVLGPHGQLHFPRREPRGRGGQAGTAAPRHAGAVTWAPLGKWLVYSRRGRNVPCGGGLAPQWGVGRSFTAWAPLRGWGTASSLPQRFGTPRRAPGPQRAPAAPGRARLVLRVSQTRSRVGSHCAGTPCCIVLSLLYIYVCTVGTEWFPGVHFQGSSARGSGGVGKAGLVGYDVSTGLGVGLKAELERQLTLSRCREDASCSSRGR